MTFSIQTLVRLAFFILLVALSNEAFAQDQDQFRSVSVLPRLKSSFTFGGSLNPRFQLTEKGRPLPKFELGIAGGYSFFFDLHGKKRFRLLLDLDYAGFEADKSSASIGIRGIYSSRVYGPHFGYGSLGLTSILRLTRLEKEIPQNGIEFGPGLELAFGSFFHSQPYLFAEISNSVFLTYSTINRSFSVFAKVELRFDWAFRDRSVHTDINDNKWE